MSGKAAFARGLVWLRSDLRLHDNTALHRAAKGCRELAAIFIACPKTWRDHEEGEPLVSFRMACLRELQEEMGKRNIPLYFLELGEFSQVPAALRQIAEKLSIDAVYANAEYPLDEQRRDRAVRESLREIDVPVEYATDRTLVPPGSIRTGSGEAYKVFTPFKRAFISQYGGDSYQPLPAPHSRKDNGDWPAWIEVQGPNNLVQTVPDSLAGYELSAERGGTVLGWQPGERAAARRLDEFSEIIDGYEDERDFPAIDATSRLSPYLNSGAISVRQCAHMALEHNNDRWSGGSDGIACWLGELIWREFYTHLMDAYPRLCMHKPFKPETERVPWSGDELAFRRWTLGKTGVPIVDAAMRQLEQTGWMHNRLRMVVASFLTKNLLIDWRWGERHFMNNLVDADFASNNGGWQWAASTGTDAVPYFRVFNPYSQSKKFDPRGDFIRRFVPELRGVRGDDIHCPPDTPDYPRPICDVKETRKRAIEAFAQLKG
ncbi:cryptochrome/photolyase family protein [Microbulbifer yueqingensis]|uniref:Deoxyribodipyrimidine photo-lyase n=1 Tax=Microbulbifer yueqingensis TaxID=658219 RepID=A0A1G8VV28_9GAMM|nr:FAD-binding domain-containing protein [Microbulbifer yueqingensis]SDJ69829.1 deoxyribodipyrimidine photo-lyase type I [Microbulbifer yueqingensis]